MESLFQRMSTRLGVIRVRSAVNPLLWLVALVTPGSFIGAYYFREVSAFSAIFFLIGCIPIFAALVAYFYFMIKDPKKLQSEDYQLRAQMLEILEKKGGEITIAPANLDLIANPAAPRIGYDRGAS